MRKKYKTRGEQLSNPPFTDDFVYLTTELEKVLKELIKTNFEIVVAINRTAKNVLIEQQ